MAHHEPAGLAYADYFAAAAAAGAVATLVPEVDAVGAEDDEDLHLYGVGVHHHQHGAVDMFGAASRSVHMPPPGAMMASPVAAAANGKAALGLGGNVDDDDVVVASHFGDHHHRLQQGQFQAPLSLSLHGTADAAALALALQHHHQLGGVLREHEPAAWPQQQGQQQQGAWWQLRGSRFLRPTQQLLTEFCTLPVENTSAPASGSKPTKTPASEDGAGSSSAAPSSAQIQGMSAAELQRLKAKLYAMLQEVERRYRRYREQMRAVAGSFEAVAGEQAAAAYTRLASRTISRHFRSLRDGVAAQMQAVRRALGEKDADGGGGPAAGMMGSRGETTPRLRAIDQCLRQHRAYQAGVLESQPWRPQRGLPERAVSILRAWLFEHFLHPYPSDVDKHILARQTGLSRSQVSNWFINARVRLWKPMVEEMYSEEMKDPHEATAAAAACSNANNNSLNTTSSYASELGHGGAFGVDGGGGERKPTRAQLMVHDAGSLASVVSIGSSRDRDRDQQQLQQSSINFGMMDHHHLDFDAYNDGGPAGFGSHGGGSAAGGVSLTLGLQQHAHGDDPHGGVNIAFAAAPSAAAHEFLFMAGGGDQQQQQVVAGGAAVHLNPSHGHGHGHHGQFSAGMQGDGGGGGVASSYYHHHRGLSGATGFQLLHDLAG